MAKHSKLWVGVPLVGQDFPDSDNVNQWCFDHFLTAAPLILAWALPGTVKVTASVFSDIRGLKVLQALATVVSADVEVIDLPHPSVTFCLT